MNQAIVLSKHPVGKVTESDFQLVERPTLPCEEGFFRTKNMWLSLDAGFRHWMAEGAGDNYLPGMQIGDPVQGVVIGEVIESCHSGYPVGCVVSARTAWEQFSVLDGKDLCNILLPADGVPLHQYMSTLGLTGMTAWVGLYRVGKPRAGETVVISAAGGAVGTVAGQLAKAEGCRVVGLTSTRSKADWLVTDVGYDLVIDRETQPDLDQSLRDEVPEGIDVYFDNVGGHVLDTVMSQLKEGARIALSGAISEYEGPVEPLFNSYELVTKRVRMEGFMVTDHVEEFPAILQDLQNRLAGGSLESFEQIYSGLAETPRAFCDMMHGASRGKCLVQLD